MPTACWFSCPLARRDAAVLLGVYSFLILAAIGAEWAAHPEEPFWFLLGELVILSTTFFVTALWKRVAKAGQHEPPAVARPLGLMMGSAYPAASMSLCFFTGGAGQS